MGYDIAFVYVSAVFAMPFISFTKFPCMAVMCAKVYRVSEKIAFKNSKKWGETAPGYARSKLRMSKDAP